MNQLSFLDGSDVFEVFTVMHGHGALIAARLAEKHDQEPLCDVEPSMRPKKDIENAIIALDAHRLGVLRDKETPTQDDYQLHAMQRALEWAIGDSRGCNSENLMNELARQGAEMRQGYNARN